MDKDTILDDIFASDALGILDIKGTPISDYPISSAHKQLLSKLYKINHPKYGKLEDAC